MKIEKMKFDKNRDHSSLGLVYTIDEKRKKQQANKHLLVLVDLFLTIFVKIDILHPIPLCVYITPKDIYLLNFLL